MLVTKTELEKFSKVTRETDDTLADVYIGSAEELINDYVGFDVSSKEEWMQEITEENIVYSEDGTEFYSDEEMTTPAIIPLGADVTLIEGTKYHFYTTTRDVIAPPIFKLVCLEIATLIQAEENTNIGVNTNAEFGVSRTFLNIVDYTPYLKKLSVYRTADALEM